MTIYELQTDGIVELNTTSFSAVEIRERDDLQRILKDNIDVISPGTLIISEEFGQWEDSRRRIDLLGIDAEDARLVVIELKRTVDGGHMELQALRYSAMISTMTFEQVVQAFDIFLKKNDRDDDAEELILKHLGLDEPDEETFAQDVRIVLASADFSKELTTTAMWLNERGLDIRCVRLKPYLLDQRILLDVQSVVPLPEAVDYQIRIAEKQQSVRKSRGGDNTIARKISDLVEHYVRDEIGATFIQPRGKMVWFLPATWDDRLPKIGDAWKRLRRLTPLAFWVNITNRKPGLKMVVELGRIPNYKFRQQLVRDLRDAGCSIDRRGDRPDARYTRIRSQWQTLDVLSLDQVDLAQIPDEIDRLWKEFSSQLVQIEQVVFDRDWSKASLIPSEENG
ncbi:MAG: hypothetical protein JKY96_09200 [Phycisphaerales bacterium]|nr:hypothetical protein [Phycisphaerales bacterium]